MKIDFMGDLKMKKFKWHIKDWQDEGKWDEIEAYNMSDAAEKVLEELHAEEFQEIDVVIATCGLEEKKRFHVSAEYDVSFYATEQEI